jgi:hypothetical protein
MGLAFVVLFPMGAIIVRTMKFKGIVWVHVACQLIGWIMVIAGLALGTRVASIIDIVSISLQYNARRKLTRYSSINKPTLLSELL